MITLQMFGRDYYPWKTCFHEDGWKRYIGVIEEGDTKSLETILNEMTANPSHKMNKIPKDDMLIIGFVAAVENLQIEVAKMIMTHRIFANYWYFQILIEATNQLLYHSLISKRRVPDDNIVPMLDFLEEQKNIRPYTDLSLGSVYKLQLIYHTCILQFPQGNITKLMSFLVKEYHIFSSIMWFTPSRSLMYTTINVDRSVFVNTALYLRFLRDDKNTLFHIHINEISCNAVACYNWLVRHSYPKITCAHYPYGKMCLKDICGVKEMDLTRFRYLISIADSKGIIELEKLCLRHVLFAITVKDDLKLNLSIEQIYKQFTEAINVFLSLKNQ
jgi:hypothetical protein